jgi:penicillin-binding protein 1C
LDGVFDLLKESGIGTLREKFYEHGLPLVLGGCEVQLTELTNAYATLASGGVYRPLRWLAKAPEDTSSRVLSAEACWLVTEILAKLERPDLPSSWEFTPDLPMVAWKTGTSYGRRDAWTVGYNPQYTIGVWAGNFSGEGSVDLVGAESAAPVMFDLFNQLMRGQSPRWFVRPEGVSQRLVCAESGMPPNDPSAATVWEEYIPGVSPSARCNVHQTIYVDTSTGYRLLPACVQGSHAARRRVAIWPPKIATWLKRAGQSAPLPPLAPDCRGQLAAEGPVISSPADDSRFVLQSGRPAAYQKIPLIASTDTGGELHWFVDRELLASGRAGEAVFYEPEPGRHRLLCVDDQGRSAEVTITVENGAVSRASR